MGCPTAKSMATGCQYLGAALLFYLGISRIFTLSFLANNVVLSLYYILFGAIILMGELGFGIISRKFHFLDRNFGKAFFALFIATFTFTISYWVQLGVSLFFLVAGGCFVVLGFTSPAEETTSDPAREEDKKKAEPEGKRYGTVETDANKAKTEAAGLPAPIV